MSRALSNALRTQQQADDPIQTFHDLALEMVMAAPDQDDLVVTAGRTPDGGFFYVRMREEAAREVVEGLLWSMEGTP